MQDLWVQRGRRDVSPPAPIILPQHRALQDLLAFLASLEMSASREKSAGWDQKVGRGTSGLRDR